MNFCRFRWSAVFVAVWFLSGCNRDPEPVGPETTDAEIRLANISGWYVRFASQYARPPRDDAEFFAYVRKIPANERVVADEQLADYYTSPRDKQPWQIRYTVPVDRAGTTAQLPPNAVLIHEQTGQAGKKLVVFGNGFTALVDDAKLAELIR